MYEVLDELIIKEVCEGELNPLRSRAVQVEAARLAKLNNRKAFRVIDGRLTALKKQGMIEYHRKILPCQKQGWRPTCSQT